LFLEDVPNPEQRVVVIPTKMQYRNSGAVYLDQSTGEYFQVQSGGAVIFVANTTTGAITRQIKVNCNGTIAFIHKLKLQGEEKLVGLSNYPDPITTKYYTNVFTLSLETGECKHTSIYPVKSMYAWNGILIPNTTTIAYLNALEFDPHVYYYDFEVQIADVLKTDVPLLRLLPLA
jgi:hypothetical protein